MMMGTQEMLVDLESVKDYLGESGDYNDQVIREIILSAQEELQRATGKDFRLIEKNETAKRIVKMTAWLSFFADRDEAKNTTYIEKAREGLIKQLQYGGDVENHGSQT